MDKRQGSGWLLLGCGLVLVLVGLVRGEAHLVLLRAVLICLECIGLK